MPVTRKDSTTPSLDKSTEAGSLAEPRALIVTTIEASMRRGRDDQRPARARGIISMSSRARSLRTLQYISNLTTSTHDHVGEEGPAYTPAKRPYT